MRKVPCEIIVWNVLPCIRRALATSLFKKGLNQKEIANKIGVSSAAISQYLASKRGKNMRFNEKILKEIEKSADAILKGNDAIEEICKICKIIKEEMSMEEEIC